MVKRKLKISSWKNNNDINRPLHKAVFNPAVRLIMVKLLLEHGADVNLQNESGDSGNINFSTWALLIINK